ncbi:Hpt domain-containing protein, partial [uncultured Aquincola sp.]|uniref:Hpt domain-containing response regulator n=1 Tax=uncultured Aquincola sp. TaxID=886556 RepID=UPI0032B145CA
AGPVIALTANVMASDVAHYRALGFNDVLAKPLQLDRFYAVLARWLPAPPVADEDAEAAFAQEMARLSQLFRQGLPRQLDDIEDAITRADAQALAGLVHTLKGTAGSFGFETLTAPCLQMEQLIKQAQVGRASLDVQALQALAGRLRSEAEAGLFTAQAQEA